MTYIIIGIFAFLLFILYDINGIIIKNKLLHYCFFAGIILLTAATIGIIVTSGALIQINIFRIALFGMIAILFLVLMIYTLFFALPFHNTYIDNEANPMVYKEGVYALCRHPGVLWFIGFYIFMGLALRVSLFFAASIVFSIMNILYVLFQDRWTFLKSFTDYEIYKTDTPFLFPSIKSIKHCIKTL